MGTVKKYAERLSGVIMPYLLCAVMMSAALNIYTDKVFDGWTAAAAVWTAALFALFGKLRRFKLGGLVYTAIALLMLMTPGLFLHGSAGFEFIQWFFSGAQAVATRFEFSAVFMILFGFFFASTLFYFTQVVYRSAAVALISLIPFALAVKAVISIDIKYPIFIASLNLFMFVYYSRRDFFRTAKPAGGSVLGVYGDFALAAALLAAIIPKPQTAPFYEKFEEAVNRFSFGGSGVTEMSGEYSRYSGNADDMLKGESRLLYYIRTNAPVYMKTQVFDIYDSEKRRWTSEGDTVQGRRSWQDTAKLMSFEKLSEAIKAAAENRPEIYEEYPSARVYEGITEEESFCIVYTGDFYAVYVLAPLRITDAVISSTAAKYSVRSVSGEVFTNLSRLPASSSYTVRYYSEEIFDSLINAGICNISMEDYGNLLWQTYLMPPNDSEYSRIGYEFYIDYVNASKYKTDNETVVSEEIQALADELTAGLEYDYQKAAALESYFHSGAFKYDLNYQAPEELDTPEYFIFESKTGTCSDFATAYTLLARAAGLTARYTEGFTMSQGTKPQPGVYYIYTENAHAYPEVYIPGIGWRIYEPTVASPNRNDAENGANGGMDRTEILLTAAVVIVGMGIFVLFVLLLPKITEMLFVFGVRFSSDAKAVKKLYMRHAERLCADPLPLTPEETAALTAEKTGIPLEPLTVPLTEYCYGGKAVTKEERKAAYECYRAQKKALKKLTKNKRKKG